MKISTIVLCFLLAGSLRANVHCPTANPFIKSLRSGIVLPSPIPAPGSSCGYLWSTGTCCNEGLLKAGAFAYNAKTDESLGIIHAKLKRMQEQIERLRENDKDTFNKFFDKNPKLHEFKSLRKIEKVNEEMGNAWNCWNHMKKVRGSALCNTCAENSWLYFAGNKARLAQADCSAMLNICKRHFQFVLRLVEGIYIIAADLTDNTKGDIKKMANAITEHMVPAAQNLHILSLLSQGSNADSQLCEHLYNLNNPSFLDKIRPFFENYGQKVDDILKGLFEMCKKKDCTLSGGRLLHELLFNLSNWNDPNPLNDLFRGDILVTPNEHHHDHWRPMNCSLKFP